MITTVPKYYRHLPVKPPEGMVLGCRYHGETDNLFIFPEFKVRRLWDNRWVMLVQRNKWLCDSPGCFAGVEVMWR